ncbi:MAG: hypothetical protein GVX96_02575 [Bacteroidetes bacterium]|jgi:tetrahydromethanopterin S-methyltransferase subunit E|nr:hypothetical protein [Bacteroidota bacterium]
MRVSKLLKILGILLVLYGLIFGLQFEFTSDWETYSFHKSYSLNFGTIILGIVLIYAGISVRKNES